MKDSGKALLNNMAERSAEIANGPAALAQGRRKNLRVAAIVEDLRPPLDEGAKKSCFSLICSLREQGVQVSTFTRYGNPLLENVFALPGNKLLFGSSFARDLKQQAPDIMLYMPASSGTIGAFARAALLRAQSPGTPLALLSLQYRNMPAFARHLSLHRCADVVLTQSRISADVFRSLGCRTVLLPGAVDRGTFRPVGPKAKHELRIQYGFQDADRIVLHVGHCKRGRNVGVLAQLSGLGYRVILVASTSTALDRELLAELERAGVRVIADFVGDIQHYYQLADCYLFPVFSAASAIDAPLSILEAMACNLPVVTTSFGALPTMFQGGNGLYYAEDEEEMIRLVGQAIDGPASRTLEKVSPYSWDRAACSIMDALREACAA